MLKHLIGLLFCLFLTTINFADDHTDILYAIRTDDDIDIYVYSISDGMTTHIDTLHFSGSDAAWSPDKRYITLMSNARSETGRQLRLYDTVEQRLIPISETIDENDCQFPVHWSPDERFITYFTTNSLNVVDTTNSNYQSVTLTSFERQSTTFPTVYWSPNGRYLLELRHNQPPVVRDMWIENMANSIIFEFPSGVSNMPVWSPNSRYIAYQAPNEGDTVILIYDVVTATVTEYETSYVREWSLDSRFLATYRRDSNGSWITQIIDIQNETINEPTPDPTWLSQNLWSGDNGLLIPNRSSTAVSLYYPDNDRWVSLVDNGSFFYAHRWSPDGQHMAFTVNEDGQKGQGGTQVYIVDTAADEPTTTILDIPTRDPFRRSVLQWSQSGRYVMIDGNDGLHIFDIETQALTIIDGTEGEALDIAHGWIDDQLLVSQYDNGNSDIFLYNSQDETLTNLITTPDVDERFLDWGSDETASLIFCGMG